MEQFNALVLPYLAEGTFQDIANSLGTPELVWMHVTNVVYTADAFSRTVAAIATY